MKLTSMSYFDLLYMWTGFPEEYRMSRHEDYAFRGGGFGIKDVADSQN